METLRIFQNLPCDFLLLHPTDGRVISSNRFAQTNLGYNSKELSSLGISDIVPELTITTFKKLIEPLFSEKRQFVVTPTHFRNKDGSFYSAELQFILSTFENETVVIAFSLAPISSSDMGFRKEREKKYRAVMENINDALIEVNLEGVIVFVNDQFCTMSGFTRNELIGSHAQGLLYSDENPEIVRQKIKTRMMGISEVYELQLRKKNGELIWIQNSAMPMFNNKDVVVGAIGILKDVSERRRIEMALRQSEEKYRHFFEDDLTGDYVSLPSGRLLDCNQAFCTMLGFASKAEALATNMNTVHVNVVQRAGFLDELRRRKRVYNAERVLVRKDGEKIFVIENAIGRFVGGELVELRGYVFDITKRKQAEDALRQSEERYHDLFDNAPDMYLITGTDWAIFDVNLKGLQTLGFARDEIIGKKMSDLLYSEDTGAAHHVMDSILNVNVIPKNVEVRFLDHQGHIIWFSQEFSVLRQEDGEIESIRVICRDITQRKHLEDELARSHRLESAGRVAGQIAHDFNNLLAPLMAYPSLLRDDLRDQPEAIALLEEMETAARKIAEINQQLLALGRRGHCATEPLNLNELIQKLLPTIAYSSELNIKTDLSEDLFLIKAGAAQLTRALTNLLMNAVEAMQGSGTVEITTANIYLDKLLSGYQTVKPGEYVKLSITDLGPGIEAEILDKIFEPFFTTKCMDRMRGSGLGLSIVHGIVDDHDGYITVDTQIGGGTTFSVYFPITREVKQIVGQLRHASSNGSEKILIIDDDPLQRRVMLELLTRLGYRVATVESGEEAIAFLKRNNQDLLIIDMVMNGIDGAETYRQIREQRPKQKAILFSGYAMSQRVDQALDWGASAFLAKPIHFDKLAVTVRQVLDQNGV